MDAVLYVNIVEKMLLPFLRNIYPTGHRLMQDNDLKHVLHLSQKIFARSNVNWWKKPPPPPPKPPKECQRREVKSKTKDELVSGILEFWNTVGVTKCKKYIGHLRKVISRVREVNGDATGY